MNSFLSKLAEPSYALFRIVAGAMFAVHGAQKVFGVLGGFGGNAGEPAPMLSQMWVGGLIELVGVLLVLIVFQARCAAFIASGSMAVAYFQFHQPKGALPSANGGELAVLYCFAFLVIATKGPGIWSLSSRS